jgi:hypothetical protein
MRFVRREEQGRDNWTSCWYPGGVNKYLKSKAIGLREKVISRLTQRNS